MPTESAWPQRKRPEHKPLARLAKGRADAEPGEDKRDRHARDEQLDGCVMRRVEENETKARAHQPNQKRKKPFESRPLLKFANISATLGLMRLMRQPHRS